MALARYEVRVNGRLSERARSAFCAMNVTSVPPQTIVFGDLGEVTDLADLLALCNAMGLEVVSVRRLPSAAAIATGTATADNAVLGIRSEPGRHSDAGIADTEDTHPVDQRWSGPQPDSL